MLDVRKRFVKGQCRSLLYESGVDLFDDWSTFFQFQNKTLKSFSKWCILMDKCRPRFEVWRIFQQYLSVIYHVVLVVNSELRALEFKVFEVNIFLSFFVHFNRFFFQLVFSSPVSSISTSIHWSPIPIKTKTIKQKPWI